MADVSVLNLNGTNYTIKDSTARSTAQAAQTAAGNALERTYDFTYTQDTETITFTKYSE